MKGIELIKQERQKQIDKGFGPLYDIKENKENQLSFIGSMLAASLKLEFFEDLLEEFKSNNDTKDIPNWNNSDIVNYLNKSPKERLILAGAFIAAEIDRLNYIENNNIEGRV